MNFLEDYNYLLIIFGIAFMIAGFLFYKLTLAIPGFIVGGIIGLLIGSLEGSVEPYMIGLIGGVIGAIIAILLEELIIFLFGALAGILFLYFINNDPSTLGVIIIGITGGIIALVIWKMWIIVITSIIGAILFCIGTDTLDSGLPILLSIIGIGVQYGIRWLFPSLAEKDSNKEYKKYSKLNKYFFSYKRASKSATNIKLDKEELSKSNNYKTVFPSQLKTGLKDSSSSHDFVYKRKILPENEVESK